MGMLKRAFRRRGPAEPEDVDPVATHDATVLLERLRAMGVPVKDLAYLGEVDLRPAVGVLRETMEATGSDDLAGYIATMLAEPWAKAEVLDAFLREYARLDRSEMYRWRIGSALEQFAGPAIGERLLPIVADPRQGSARQMGALALGRTGLPAARDVLVSLLDDEEVVGHAAEALGRLGDPSAIAALEGVTDERDWVRSEVAKAIARLRRKER